jgi:hypothetical protein
MATSAETLFVSAKGHVLSDNTVRYVFLRLARSVDLRGKPVQRAPRIHDLRHNSDCRVIPSGDLKGVVNAEFRIGFVGYGSA